MAEKLLMVLKNKKESGASMLEYALLAALIAVISIVAIQRIGTETSKTFSTVASAMSVAN